MWSNSVPSWPRMALAALAGMALVVLALLWWAHFRTPAVDAGDLAADSSVRPGMELIVTGEWVTTSPAGPGDMVVGIRGRTGGEVACHFEDVPAVERGGLESRLLLAGAVAVRGRYDGDEEGRPVLRGCRLLD